MRRCPSITPSHAVSGFESVNGVKPHVNGAQHAPVGVPGGAALQLGRADGELQAKREEYRQKLMKNLGIQAAEKGVVSLQGMSDADRDLIGAVRCPSAAMTHVTLHCSPTPQISQINARFNYSHNIVC